MTIKQILRPFAVVAALNFAPLVQAESGVWYLGADLGQSRFTLDLPSPYSTNTPGASEDRRDIAYTLSGGYRFSPYIAVEAGYMNLGSYRLKYQDDSQHGKATASAHGFAASALWQLPLGERWGIFFKTGVLFARADGKARVTDAGNETEYFRRKENAAVPIIGLGVSYAPTREWTLRLQYQDVGAARIAEAAGYKLRLSDDVWSLGATYAF